MQTRIKYSRKHDQFCWATSFAHRLSGFELCHRIVSITSFFSTRKKMSFWSCPKSTRESRVLSFSTFPPQEEARPPFGWQFGGNLLSSNIRRVAYTPINGIFQKRIPQLLREGLVLENRQWLQEHEQIMCSHL